MLATARAAFHALPGPGAVLRATEAAAQWAGGRLLDEVGKRVDLTPLVAQVVDLDSLVADLDVDAIARRLDVDAVAGRLDVDAVARRLDIDAVTDRLDLVALVETVIAEIDLPAIIRDSTGSVASSTVRGVRMQSVSGDEAIARAVDRLRLRGRHRPVPEPRADGVT